MTTIHGHKSRSGKSLEYKTWLGIKARCYTPTNKDYPKYGAKGIGVSDEWRNSFVTFLSDMGPRPSPTHQIDRKDPSKGYSAENCRWVTPHIQGSENKRNLQPITVDGIEFHSINAACRHFGIGVTSAHYRLKTGVPIDQVFVVGKKRMKSRRDRTSYLKHGHPDRQDRV